MTRTTSGELTQLMSHLNRLIYEASAVNRYATFFFGVLDPGTGKFQYVNAGHNPPVFVRNWQAAVTNRFGLTAADQ